MPVAACLVRCSRARKLCIKIQKQQHLYPCENRKVKSEQVQGGSPVWGGVRGSGQWVGHCQCPRREEKFYNRISLLFEIYTRLTQQTAARMTKVIGSTAFDDLERGEFHCEELITLE